ISFPFSDRNVLTGPPWRENPTTLSPALMGKALLLTGCTVVISSLAISTTTYLGPWAACATTDTASVNRRRPFEACFRHIGNASFLFLGLVRNDERGPAYRGGLYFCFCCCIDEDFSLCSLVFASLRREIKQHCDCGLAEGTAPR